MTQPVAKPSSADLWIVAFAAMLLLLTAGATLAPLWAILHSQWTGVAMYQHGYLVAGMAAWLAWYSLRRRPPAALAPGWRYLFLLGAALGGLMTLELLYLNVPRVFLLPPLLVAAIGAVFGGGAARALFWPAMLLYGALPVWSLMNGALQSLTTAVVSRALTSSGIPVLIEGNFVNLPAGVFEIAEGCSGLRYAMVAATLALFYALAWLPTWGRRSMLVGVSFASALLCNWLRVYVIILAGHLTDMRHYLVTVDHITFGWALFVAFMLPVFWFARRLAVPAAVEPHRRFPAFRPKIKGRAVAAAAVVACVLLSSPRLAWLAAAQAESSTLSTTAIQIPSSDTGRLASWRPVFVNALESSYVSTLSGAAVEVYIALYPRQDAEHKLIAFENSFVPDDWDAIGRRRLTVPLGNGAAEVIEYEGYQERRRRLVWAWYRVAGETTTGVLEAKALELKGLLAGRRDAGALAISAECDVDCDSARRLLREYLRSSIESLQW